jgi:actin-related protein
VLSLYASGRTTGVAVHCGDTRSYVVPVQECKSLEPSVLFAPRGGRDVDAALAKLLARRTNAEAAAAAAAVIRDPALLRALKEKHGYVAPNFERECESLGGQHPDWFDRQFQLPDGRQLTVAARERFECCEALVAGGGADSLGQLVYAAIAKVIHRLQAELLLIAAASSLARPACKRKF